MQAALKMFILACASAAAEASGCLHCFRVEFPFEVGKVSMPPGEYLLESADADENSMRLIHEGSGKSVFLNLPAIDVNRAGPRAYPQMVFRCEHQNCEVAAVSNVRPGQVCRSWKALSAERNIYLRTVALNTVR